MSHELATASDWQASDADVAVQVTAKLHAPTRVAAMLLLAAVLAMTASRSAGQMEKQIETAVDLGEEAFLQQTDTPQYSFAGDRPLRYELNEAIAPRGNAGAPNRDVVATVQVPYAPSGYVLSRDRSGCWRLPAHGHCWHAAAQHNQ